jgi:3-deoxy-D-manno-octulosonate 8-phosphate phosphatase (KDO 8-P phosphatase)
MNLKKKCQNIKLIATDVDGVLTDGGRYFSEKGEKMKKFHVRDGMAVNILLRNDIPTIIITKENSLIVKKWAKEMNVTQTFSGVKNKEKILLKICKKYNVSSDEIAFIGDDINDLPLLDLIGFSSCPFDGDFQVKENVDYVCKNNGGHAVLREITNFVLSNKLSKETKWY